MENLPSELQVQILSYLPARDVLLSKGLSTSISKIIRKFVSQLTIPELDLSFEDFWFDVKLNIRNQRELLSYIIFKKGKMSIKESNRKWICDPFFGPEDPECKKNDFTWVFRVLLRRPFALRLNITCVERIPLVKDSLVKAINKEGSDGNRLSISEITFKLDMKKYERIDIRDLLQSISENVVQRQDTPRVRFMITPTQMVQLYQDDIDMFRRLNPRFPIYTLQYFGFEQTGKVFAMLAKNWIRNPVRIHIFMRSQWQLAHTFDDFKDYLSGNRSLDEIRTQFEITMQKPEGFHTATDHDPSSVLFTDKAIGHSLLFTKIPKRRFSEDTIDNDHSYIDIEVIGTPI